IQVIRSYFINLSIDAIFILGELYREILQAGSQDPCFIFKKIQEENVLQLFSKEDREKTEKFLNSFNRLRREFHSFRLSDLLNFIIKETGYDLFILSEPRGFRAYANINKLVRLAFEYEREHGNDFGNFLEYVEFLKVNEVRQGEAQISSEKSRVVKIMTIHQAKGLEFPVVIIADAGRGFRTDSPNIFDLDFELGYLVLMKEELSEKEEYKTPLFNRIKELRQKREFEEQKRVFYVAATRAREHLIISGGADPELKKETYLNWVLRYIISDDFAEKYPEPSSKLNIFKIPEFRKSLYKRHSVRWKELVNAPEHRIRKFIESASRKEVPERAILENAEKFLSGFNLNFEQRRVIELTPTKITDYHTCPFLYYLKHVLHLEPENDFNERPSALTGLIIHKFIQECDLHKQYVKDEIKSELINSGMPENKAGEYSLCLEKMFLTREWAEVRAAEKVWREVELTSKINEIAVNSKIDLAYYKSGSYHILDFKSNNILEERVDEISQRYLLQLFIYQNAVKEMFPGKTVRAGLYFIYPNILKEFDPGVLSSLSGETDRIIEEILNLGDEVSGKNSEFCKYCELNKICKEA
ncbi:MAG TPA: hypothetical protein ENN73_06150, partial [Firmicutes bacterium]|nr:hypothetical protein [Bacillota bacterium]